MRPSPQEKLLRDFPGGPVVKKSPFSAGDASSMPGWGTMIPHAAGATKPACATRESCPATVKIQHSQKKTVLLLPTVKFELLGKIRKNKLISSTVTLTASLYLKTCLMRLGLILINVIFFLMSYNEMCQHLKDPYSSGNQYLPYGQSMMLANCVWVRDLSRSKIASVFSHSRV